jgi:hypothetical protein
MKTLLVLLTLVLLYSGGVKAETADPQNNDLQVSDENALDVDSDLLAPNSTESNDSDATFETDEFSSSRLRRPPHRPIRRHPPGRYPDPGRYPGPGRYPPPYHGYSDYVECSSWSYRYAECFANGYIRNAWVYRQNSRSSCSYGYSWGIIGNRLWVDNGCRATFRVQY